MTFGSLILLLATLPVAAQTKTITSPESLYARCKPSVVTIVTFDANRSPLGQGSGFIVGKNRVVTNYHVVAGSASASVVFSDGSAAPATGVIAGGAEKDLVIVEVETGDRPALVLGDELQLKVGDTIYAIGAPKGLSASLSNGLVSAFRQDEGRFLVQITAAIAPGSSGGPLLSNQGQVVGVTTSRLKDGGFGFAIGAGDVQRLLKAPLAVKMQLSDLVPHNQEASQEIPEDSTKPLSKDEILSLLTSGVPAGRVASLVKKRGIDFAPDDGYLEQVLKVLGLTPEDIKDPASTRAAPERVESATNLLAAFGDAFKIDEVDCTQYENAGGCRVWNQLVRSKNEFVVNHLLAWKETYVWFDRSRAASDAGIFIMVSLSWHDNNQLKVARWTYIPGLIESGKSPTKINLRAPSCSDEAACDARGLKYEQKSAEGETCEFQPSPSCEDGFRDLTLTADELSYTIGFSKGRKHGTEVTFSEAFSRSTGGFRYTEWEGPEQMEGTQFRRAALYRYAALQK